MKKIIFCFGILLFAVSCSNSQATSDEASKMKNFEILYQSEYGGIGVEKTEIYTEAETFAKMWNETINVYSESAEIPAVDFDKKMVIAKHFQSQNSGGTEYEIQSVNQTGNKTEVLYKATPPDGMATMAITNPLMILVVNKVQSPMVEFKAQK